MSQAADITARAKSNLAFALIDLPPDKRKDMAAFYAFCRTVDDLADEPGLSETKRITAFDRWQHVIAGTAQGMDELEQEVSDLITRLELDRDPFLKIIEGCRMDLHQQQPATRDELMEYSYRVASCVGIASARIMGAGQESREYAISLGHALQMVNIIRDVADDYFKHGRIYLPVADMEQFGYTVEQIRERIYSHGLTELLEYEASFADGLFADAGRHYRSLPEADRTALRPAQAMGEIYRTILSKMRKDGFRIYNCRYRVGTLRKLWLVIKTRLAPN